ncbi:MAG: hypothetical protein IJ161_06045 [Bacteroidales bacterium]|nr:hypothetical protein [Bacteroidales bacterium]
MFLRYKFLYAFILAIFILPLLAKGPSISFDGDEVPIIIMSADSIEHGGRSTPIIPVSGTYSPIDGTVNLQFDPSVSSSYVLVSVTNESTAVNNVSFSGYAGDIVPFYLCPVTDDFRVDITLFGIGKYFFNVGL